MNGATSGSYRYMVSVENGAGKTIAEGGFVFTMIERARPRMGRAGGGYPQ